MKLKNLIAAALAAALLLTGCSAGGDTDTGTSGASPVGTSEDPGTETAGADPSEIVNAVLAEVPITSSVEKGLEDVPTFYSGIDITQVKSASFALRGSGGFPDEIAVMLCADDSAAASVKAAFEKRLESQIELYADYNPDEMYKLESAKIYTVGCYAVFLALSDNDRAKEIVDGKLAG